MPYITIRSTSGHTFQIVTGQRETLRAWFAEILPAVNRAYGDPRWPDEPPAGIAVHPAYLTGEPPQPDWLADSRLLGRVHPFPYKTGPAGMEGLDLLRAELVAEAETLAAGDRINCQLCNRPADQHGGTGIKHPFTPRT